MLNNAAPVLPVCICVYTYIIHDGCNGACARRIQGADQSY